MKLGAFMWGGLLGAAAVVYLQRNSNRLMMSGFSSAGKSLNNLMGNAKDKMSDMNVPMMSTQSKTTVSKTNTSSNIADTSADMGKVKNWVDKDPSLSNQVNDLLVENNAKGDAERFASTH